MSKTMLVLKASSDIADAELQNIINQCKMHGITSDQFDVDSEEDLCTSLYSGKKYDYIYLATHGCNSHFGNVSETLNISWIKFAAHICQSGVAKQGAIFFHSCCRGGLNQVGWEMFGCCERIEYVCGPRHNAFPIDLAIAFNLFIYFIENRRLDPVRASEKVLSATDVRLVCLDRIETVCDLEYKFHNQSIRPTVEAAFQDIAPYSHEEGDKVPSYIPPEVIEIQDDQETNIITP